MDNLPIKDKTAEFILLSPNCPLFGGFPVYYYTSYNKFAQFQELESLGFSGFAIGFYEDKMELVSTSSMSKSFTPQMIEYLHALTITGEVIFVVDYICIKQLFLNFSANPPKLSSLQSDRKEQPGGTKQPSKEQTIRKEKTGRNELPSQNSKVSTSKKDQPGRTGLPDMKEQPGQKSKPCNVNRRKTSALTRVQQLISKTSISQC